MHSAVSVIALRFGTACMSIAKVRRKEILSFQCFVELSSNY